MTAEKYESLLELIQPYVKKNFDDLPEILRHLVIENSLSACWDTLSIDERMVFIKKCGAQDESNWKMEKEDGWSFTKFIIPFANDPDLPGDVCYFVTRKFHPMIWAECTPEQRIQLAQQIDTLNGQDAIKEIQYFFDLQCDIAEVEEEIEKLEVMSDRGIASEARIRKEDLTQSKAKLTELKNAYKIAQFSKSAKPAVEPDRPSASSANAPTLPPAAMLPVPLPQALPEIRQVSFNNVSTGDLLKNSSELLAMAEIAVLAVAVVKADALNLLQKSPVAGRLFERLVELQNSVIQETTLASPLTISPAIGLTLPNTAAAAPILPQ